MCRYFEKRQKQIVCIILSPEEDVIESVV